MKWWDSPMLRPWATKWLQLECSRCGCGWDIMRVDAEGAYAQRVAENVCWDCEPEGW